MRITKILGGVLFLTMASSCIENGTKETKSPKEREVEAKVEALLSQMTLEEKIGQMTQITLDVIGKGTDRFTSVEPLELDTEMLKKAFSKYHVGSVLNTTNNRALTREEWFATIHEIQEVNARESRLKIPIIYGVDEIHGATYTADATVFPQQIAQGAARNPALVEAAAAITAYEMRASGIPWNFSPVLDLGNDPRFSRMWESFGEDPYLITTLGVAMIDGYEGKDNTIGHPEKVASCMKHFLGYHTTVSGKDRTPSVLSEDVLREYHLPPFKAAIEAGSHTIMINSGIINGIPVHANEAILTKLLKEELGFKGVVVTDWSDIEHLHRRDRMAATNKEAIMLAINAGIDVSMVPYEYERFCDHLLALVQEGKIQEARINDAVRRVLRVKFLLGLFETPVTHYKEYPKFGSPEFEKVAFDMALEAITLLKNENQILPLRKDLKVLVTGPNAHSMRTLNGAWTYSWQGEKVEAFAQKYHTILKAVENKIGKDRVVYVPGVQYNMEGKYYEEFTDRMDEAVQQAHKVDVILLCVGENTYTEKPGDLNDLYLSDLQTQLAQKLAATGKPVILILNEGRPRIISRIEPQMKGVIQTYLPGNFGGDALAELLFGDANPSGKLPYTYPRYPNATVTYLHKWSEEQKKVEGAYNYEADYNPQYPFGFGLSYTTFDYTDLKVSKKTVKKGESLTVTVTVTNSEKRAGKEVVHLYTSDLYATSIVPDVKRLRRFEKIALEPGEHKEVEFTIHPEDLSYVGRNAKTILEPGDFEILIADLKEMITVTE